MRKYLKFHGVNIQNANGLPQFVRSPEAAMASMPDGFWNVLYDPDEISGDGLSAMNRVSGDINLNVEGGVITIQAFPNGQSAFSPRLGSDIAFLNAPAIAPDAWTVMAVVKPEADSTVQDIVNSVPENDTAEGVGLRIASVQNGDGIAVYEFSNRVSGAPQRLSYNGGFAGRADPTLVMVTFSTQRGLAIWDNGVEVAAASEDRRPLEVNFGAGQWQVFRSARSDYGLVGQLNADLGLERNAGYRRMIERHVRAKYAIAAIPG